MSPVYLNNNTSDIGKSYIKTRGLQYDGLEIKENSWYYTHKWIWN